ncbi:MAG TPA: porin PorA family protein [Micromonosporaceae bacterium]
MGAFDRDPVAVNEQLALISEFCPYLVLTWLTLVGIVHAGVEMRSRTVGAVLAVLGVLCLAAAAILAWVVAPSRAKLPSDLSTNRQYSGMAKIALDPSALASGNLRQAVLIARPADVDRKVKVQATSGDAAEVQDSRTISAGGVQIGATNVSYAVDRKSLLAVSSHPSGWTVSPAQGLTVSFPIGSKKQTYTGWVNETQSTTPVKYVKEETHAGVDTFVYQSDATAKQIKDEQVLSALPKAIPAGTLAQLALSLQVPPDVAATLSRALPSTGQPVPLSYTYEVHSTYWVEPTTGSVIDVQREEIRRAGLQLPNGTTVADVLSVYDVTTKGTDASVKAAATDAQDKKDSLNAVRRTWPLSLLGVGVVLLAVGLVLALRRPRPRPMASDS